MDHGPGDKTIRMYLEIERIGELFGVRDEDIPAFITAVAEVFSRHLRQGERVEDWLGKTVRSTG